MDTASKCLTGDTRIKLSKIKKMTQDARRTYKIGEISETTGLQKTANGWREVKKGGAGSAAPKAGSDNTERTAGGSPLTPNDKIANAAWEVFTKRRGENLTAKDVQKEYGMSEAEANETIRRVNKSIEAMEKSFPGFAKPGRT